MNVLAIEPYYSGSHRSFLDAVSSRSRHQWTLMTGPGRHWKWRMRNAPLDFAKQLAAQVVNKGRDFATFDAVFCSEMLDLPQWRGFLNRPALLAADLPFDAERIITGVASLPAVTYFHENQWTYPQSPRARPDSHYGYTNLLTALASDEVWFNSRFHQTEFLSESKSFVAKMPDSSASHDLNSLEARCHVIAPGFEPIDSSIRPSPVNPDRAIRIGWVGRWEHDKRPDQFLELLETLSRRNVEFELILLGERSRQHPQESLKKIERRFGDQILHSGFAPTRSSYQELLRQMDVVVSTADHEFFGIAICEAISAGAVPVLPDRLSYPELVDREFLYQSIEDAAERIGSLLDQAKRDELVATCQTRLAGLRIEATVDAIDQRLDRLSVSATDL